MTLDPEIKLLRCLPSSAAHYLVTLGKVSHVCTLVVSSAKL